MIELRWSRAEDLGWANQCYASIGFALSTRDDLIAVAEADGRRVGLGRIVPISNDVGELGGMYVIPDYRGHSVARHLVSFLLERSGHRQLFCIPFLHLEPFYAEFGFERAAAELEVPAPIAQKLEWCARQYPNPVVLLVRSAAGPRGAAAGAD